MSKHVGYVIDRKVVRNPDCMYDTDYQKRRVYGDEIPLTNHKNCRYFDGSSMQIDPLSKESMEEIKDILDNPFAMLRFNTQTTRNRC